MRKSLLVLATASALVAGGAARAAQPLSLANAPAGLRAGADAEAASELRGSGKWIIGAVVLALLIWGAMELLDNDDEAFPVSP